MLSSVIFIHLTLQGLQVSSTSSRGIPNQFSRNYLLHRRLVPYLPSKSPIRRQGFKKQTGYREDTTSFNHEKPIEP